MFHPMQFVEPLTCSHNQLDTRTQAKTTRSEVGNWLVCKPMESQLQKSQLRIAPTSLSSDSIATVCSVAYISMSSITLAAGVRFFSGFTLAARFGDLTSSSTLDAELLGDVVGGLASLECVMHKPCR